MKSGQPKQYLPCSASPDPPHPGGPVRRAGDRPVYVVLSVGDQAWDRHDWRPFGDRLVPLFCGGASRADSVLNGLRAIADDTSESDWILVHDAARPCLAPWHIETPVRELGHDEVGGILAVPVADTLKRETAPTASPPRCPARPVAGPDAPDVPLRDAQARPRIGPRRHRRGQRHRGHGAAAAAGAGRPDQSQSYLPLDLHLAEWILQHREDKA